MSTGNGTSCNADIVRSAVMQGARRNHPSNPAYTIIKAPRCSEPRRHWTVFVGCTRLEASRAAHLSVSGTPTPYAEATPSRILPYSVNTRKKERGRAQHRSSMTVMGALDASCQFLALHAAQSAPNPSMPQLLYVIYMRNTMECSRSNPVVPYHKHWHFARCRGTASRDLQPIRSRWCIGAVLNSGPQSWSVDRASPQAPRPPELSAYEC